MDNRKDTDRAIKPPAGTAEPVPPELRRATLQALWAADAERYEVSAVRRARLARLVVAVAAAVGIIGGGVVVATAYRRVRSQQQNRQATTYAAPPATTAPSPATMPATFPTTQAMIDAVGGQAVALGRVTYAGPAPPPRPVDLSGAPECRAMHPDGLFDDSLVVAQDGGVANVVVSLRPAGDRSLTGPPPARPAVLDQRGCRFVPRVLAVVVGQPIVVKNSDPLLHNVHSLAVHNPAFNFGQPNVDPGRYITPMKVAERFTVRCDVHPWMRAQVSVFEHPYFAVTGADGRFVIPGSVPDGRYVLVAWHERLGEVTAPVEVKPGRPVVQDLEFDPTSQGGPG